MTLCIMLGFGVFIFLLPLKYGITKVVFFLGEK